MDSYEKNILEFGAQLSSKGITMRRTELLLKSRPDGIVICGMGGSGLAGSVIKAASRELRLKVPVVIHKNYVLPTHSFRRPLYIFVSFSGNTEETISGVEATKRHSRAIVTTGGKLLAIAEKNMLPLALFASGALTPRQSVAIMLYAISSLLVKAGCMPAIAAARVNPASYRAAGKSLAAKLRGKLPIIYTDEPHAHLGYIWKIKFNETAKAHAFANVIPEMDHNELTAYDAPSKGLGLKTAVLFLKDAKMPTRLAKRFAITKKLIQKHRNLTIDIPLRGTNELEKAWNTLMLADWTTYFLGKMNGIPKKEFNVTNPLIVIDLKRRLG